jgi:hypothetical protein
MCIHPPVDFVGEMLIMSCLNADKRLYNGKGNVEFDFNGSSKPPKYPLRMDQRDTIESIRAKMVSPLQVEVPYLTVIFKSALVSILEPLLQDEYSHITSGTAVVHHPLGPHERALCGEIMLYLSAHPSLLSHSDVCFSDLFSQAQFCRSCGFEVCGQCLREKREVSPL